MTFFPRRIALPNKATGSKPHRSMPKRRKDSSKQVTIEVSYEPGLAGSIGKQNPARTGPRGIKLCATLQIRWWKEIHN